MRIPEKTCGAAEPNKSRKLLLVKMIALINSLFPSKWNFFGSSLPSWRSNIGVLCLFGSFPKVLMNFQSYQDSSFQLWIILFYKFHQLPVSFSLRRIISRYLMWMTIIFPSGYKSVETFFVIDTKETNKCHLSFFIRKIFFQVMSEKVSRWRHLGKVFLYISLKGNFCSRNIFVNNESIFSCKLLLNFSYKKKENELSNKLKQS